MTRARDLADLGGAADAGAVSGQSLIINGDMAVAQRGTSFTAPSSSAYTLDRWRVIHSSDGAVDVSQSTTAPPNFKNSLKLDVTTADTSLASGHYYIVQQKIEGQNIAHLNYGSSDAKQVTVSFWVRSNKTGTYHVELQTYDSEELARQYTIDTADTWEYKTLTWIANTDHTIPEDNSTGLHLYFWLAAGDTFDGSPIATTWANNTNRVNGQTNFLDSTSNEFYLTGVKLEVGSVATPYRHETYGENLRKCHRYFRKSEHLSGAGYHSFGTATAFGSTTASGSLYYGHMRTNPTLAQSGGNLYGAGGNHAISALSTSYFGTERAFVNITSSGLTSGYGYNWCGNNNTGAYVTMDAEL